MTTTPLETSDFRLLIPEEIWLETDDFATANQLREINGNESQQWQAYLNLLGLLGLEKWLGNRLKSQSIERHLDTLDTFAYLTVKGFKLCLIAREEFIEDGFILPKNLINNSEAAAHFYIAIEVLEEEESVLIRGFIRHDQLSQSSLISLDSNHYWLPLSNLDAEPNHLAIAFQYLSPAAIPLPQSVINQAQERLQETATRLSQWLDGMLDEGWQTLNNLLNPEVSFAFATRSLSEGIKAGKLINLGMELGEEPVALLITLTPAEEDKLKIQVQLVPVSNQPFLPPQIKLSLKSLSGKLLQEVESRQQDNYIQLKPFKGNPEKRFQLEVSFHDICIREIFEL